MICYDKLWLMMKQIKPIIESNDFSDYESNVTDPEILKVLSDYRIKRENAEKEMGSSVKAINFSASLPDAAASFV